MRMITSRCICAAARASTRARQQRDAALIRSGIADAREAIKIVNRVKIDYYLPYLHGMSQLAAVEGNTRHAETARDVATGLLEMDKVTDAEKANIAYQRALLNLQLQDSAAALSDFELATQFEPQHLAAHLYRCDMLLQSGDPTQAEQVYAEVVERFPTEPMVFNNRGMFFQRFRRTDEAQADFNRAIELNADFVPAYTNRAFSRLQAGRFSDALADLNKSIEIDPNQPAAFSLRGTAFLQTGDARSALADYETALKLDPDSPQLRADVGFSQYFLGTYDAALASFAGAQDVDPRSALPRSLARGGAGGRRQAVRCGTDVRGVDRQTGDRARLVRRTHLARTRQGDGQRSTVGGCQR